MSQQSQLFDQSEVSSKDSFLLSSENDYKDKNNQSQQSSDRNFVQQKQVPYGIGQQNSKKQKKKQHLEPSSIKQPKKNSPMQQFLYRPGYHFPDLSVYINQVIEVRIAKEYLNRQNPQLLKRQVWGNETYTSNSDCVCILQHSGLYDVLVDEQQDYEGLSFTLKVTRNRRNYSGALKNGIKSKPFKGYPGQSLKPEKIVILQSLGKIDELVKMAQRMAKRQSYQINESEHNQDIFGKKVKFDLHFKPQTSHSFHNLSNHRQLILNKYSEFGFYYNISALVDHSYLYSLQSQSDYLAAEDNTEQLNIFQDQYFQAHLNSTLSLQQKINKKFWGWNTFFLKNQSMYLFNSNDILQISKVQRFISEAEEVFSEEGVNIYDQYKVVILSPGVYDNTFFYEQSQIPLENEQFIQQVITDMIDWDNLQWDDKNLYLNNKPIFRNIQSFKFYPNKKLK